MQSSTPSIASIDLRSATIGGKQILGPFEISLPSRGTTVILGPGGSGKTTLLELLLGCPSLPGLCWEGDVCRPKEGLWLLTQGRRCGESGKRQVLGMGGAPLSNGDQGDDPEGGSTLPLVKETLRQPGVLWMLDEPDVGLEDQHHERLKGWISDAKTSGSVVVVTHHISLARALADYIIVLIEGIVTDQGEAERVFRQPASERTHTLLTLGS